MHQQKPVIILANIGTTMNDTKDDVGMLKESLKEVAIKSATSILTRYSRECIAA